MPATCRCVVLISCTGILGPGLSASSMTPASPSSGFLFGDIRLYICEFEDFFFLILSADDVGPGKSLWGWMLSSFPGLPGLKPLDVSAPGHWRDHQLHLIPGLPALCHSRNIRCYEGYHGAPPYTAAACLHLASMAR